MTERSTATLRALKILELDVDGSISYIKSGTTGRFGTGYDGLNPMQGRDNGGQLEPVFLNKREFLKKQEKTIPGI